jgi:predicted dehydrogenase
VRIAVVGTGALGRHHVRILSQLPGAELVGIFDESRERAREIAAEHRAVVLERPEQVAELAEAVVVATPTVSHTEVAVPLLERGIHVLVEKPIAASLAEADRQIEAAERGSAVLAVGHVECANPAVTVLLERARGARFVEAERLGVFSPRSLDVDVVLDLMIHDLQILHRLDPSPIREIRATGIDVLSPRVDIAHVRLELESGCVAILTASRVSAERVRKLRVFVQDAYYSLDYREQEIKGVQRTAASDPAGLPGIVPLDLAVEKAEPLERELRAFLRACRGDRSGIVAGSEGRRALATALAVVESMRGV